ncbi:MAG: GNAT family N-acetyltransferase [Candidatus Hodarchaeales archaeon]|jgi:hypothetical protein
MGLYNTKDQLIVEGNYVTMGPYGLREDAFLCEFCLKRFNEDEIDLKEKAKLHETSCKIRLSEIVEGIVTFDPKQVKSLLMERKEVINGLGYLSKVEQRTDVQMTHTNSIINKNQTVYVYIKDQKPIGFYNVGFIKISIRGKPQKRLSGNDFYVMKQFQRQNYGKKLSDFMLNTQGISPREMVYNHPSEKAVNFFQKHYEIKPIELIRWG